MHIPYRPIALSLVAMIFSGIFLARAQAGGGHYFAPVSDPVVREECGSCHLAFPPSMLPASSWKRMMGELDKHFGADASVSPATAEHITRYLSENAADTGGQRYGSKLMRGVSVQNPPLRITELPKWVREHREISSKGWLRNNVRTKANCLACHADAERGYYDE
ncbi:diheme cytochrome c [Propionivibrio sp.]|uniref:diheme cytochrome c n=1 Tax=Propionivibrio sp. TaxID=2212460 RepID=UPI0025E07A2B|nr:diheme cytochrome c [Propionivibrio sp.]MBK8399607.1 diheme cytochrome c [Propionivibrio sp.]MBK8744900.1 diheme cytochrome c [Propionivibrio sp.]